MTLEEVICGNQNFSLEEEYAEKSYGKKTFKQLIASVFLYCTLFSNRLYCYTEIYLQRTPHKFS